VSFSVTATDLIDPAPTVSCLPSSGATFPIATTQVSCTAKDAANNTSAPQTFNVNVVDTTAPAFTTIPSGTVTQEATGPTGASYSFSVAAFDAVTTSPTINCDHNPAGATYSLGPTPVSCTATDAKGNSTTQGFVVKIVDTAAPTITLAPTSPVLLDATTSAGASYSFTVTAVDANGVDSSPAIICSRGPSAETYPIGTTPVSCTAKDASNNSSPPRTFNVVVSDRSAPTLTVPATITREATGPSGAVVTFTPTATDLIDPAPTILCSPSSGATFSIATTPVSCTAKDASNNHFCSEDVQRHRRRHDGAGHTAARKHHGRGDRPVGSDRHLPSGDGNRHRGRNHFRELCASFRIDVQFGKQHRHLQRDGC